MSLEDHGNSSAPYTDGAPRWDSAIARRPAVAARLVLFVGAAPARTLCDLLAQDGIRSLWLAGPAQALRAAGLVRLDALVIDAATLAGRAGPWLVELRAALACPLLVIGENADEVDEIVALELGADAYLTLPLAARRLRAHLAALMRLLNPVHGRPERSAEAPTPDSDAWQLDRVGNRLLVAGRSVDLTEVQCALLQCMIEARGRIVTRARLAAALPRGHDLSARSVDVYIHRLRRRLHSQAVSGMAIGAVRGRGYALTAADNAAL